MNEGELDIIKAPIVIDNVSAIILKTHMIQGSGQMKAGIGGESEPSLVFNS